MTGVRAAVWGMAVALAVCAGVGRGQDAARGDGPGGAEGLRESLAGILEVQGAPALAAAGLSLDADGAPIVVCAVVGTRSVGLDAPVGLDDQWHLGSLTKSMTATMIARLVERGVMTWDMTLGETLPEIAERVPETHRGVTLRQLLMHRSGLPDDRTAGALLARAWQLEGPMHERRVEYVAMAFAQELGAPGDAMVYSNSGFVTAGTMAEAVMGRVWEDLMREEVFGPLGLATAGFGPPTSSDGRITQPLGHAAQLGMYIATPPVGGLVADNPTLWGPAGTVHMSIGDLALYAADQLAGERGQGRLLKEETYRYLHTPWGGESGYAMGWGVVVNDAGERTRLRHAGSNGRWYATIDIDLVKGLAAVTATNAANEKASDACWRASAAAMERAEAGGEGRP